MTSNKKGRQGRNSSTRERLKIEREKANHLHRNLRIEYACYKCKSDDLVEDVNVGEVICRECGYVQEGAGLMTVLNDVEPAIIHSKPYNRKNHFEQTIKQLTLTDAKVSKEHLRKIYRYCTDKKIDIAIMNKKLLNLICKRLGIPK